jgi:UDP-N-acetylmuramate dehydrogenase
MGTLRNILENCNIDAELRFDEPMAGHTTFRIGGPADAFALPRNPEALAALLKAARDGGFPAYLIGGGANLLVADAGVRGLVISTAGLGGLRELDAATPGERRLYAGAGVPVAELVMKAAELGLGGLEFAAGLPGSVGGAVYMNARCYEREFADALAYVDYLPAGASDGGAAHTARLSVERGDWAYKRTPFMPGGSSAGAAVLGAAFILRPADPAALKARMAELEADRRAKGHFDYPSAGSLFKNNRAFGRPTGKILDELGFRGLRVGDAMVSPQHANIFVNAGRATAADMIALIRRAQDAAREAFGYELEPEVATLGEF